jgi:hypothetical protein
VVGHPEAGAAPDCHRRNSSPSLRGGSPVHQRRGTEMRLQCRCSGIYTAGELIIAAREMVVSSRSHVGRLQPGGVTHGDEGSPRGRDAQR